MATRKKNDKLSENTQQKANEIATKQTKPQEGTQGASVVDAEKTQPLPTLVNKAASEEVSTAAPIEAAEASAKKPAAKRTASKKASAGEPPETVKKTASRLAVPKKAMEKTEELSPKKKMADSETDAVGVAQASAQGEESIMVASVDTTSVPIGEATAAQPKTFDGKSPAKKKRNNAKTRREKSQDNAKKRNITHSVDKPAQTEELPSAPQAQAAILPVMGAEKNSGEAQAVSAILGEPKEAAEGKGHVGEDKAADVNEVEAESIDIEANNAEAESAITGEGEAEKQSGVPLAAEFEDAGKAENKLEEKPAEASELDAEENPVLRKRHPWVFISFIILTLMVVLGSVVFVYTLFDSSDNVWFRAVDEKELPDFLGQTQSEVASSEAYKQFTNIQYKDVFSEPEDEGKVLAQFPKPPKKVSVNTKITLTIGAGVQTTVIPELVGMTREEVLALMKDSGLNLLVRTDRDSENKLGTVIKTVPAAGATASAGETLEIYVAGEELQSMATVPNCYGKTRASAEALLNGNGLSAGRIVEVFNEAPNGTVVGQGMKPGAVTWFGNAVSLSVSKGEEVIEAPPAPAPPPVSSSSSEPESSSSSSTPPVVPEIPTPPSSSTEIPVTPAPPSSSGVIPPTSVPTPPVTTSSLPKPALP